jgi:hypothetical protein
MKIKTAKKSVKNAYYKIYKIGYCNAQYLLEGLSPFAYSSGIYGWSCDYYEIEGICISTGYSPIGKNIDYDLIRKYEDKAMKILDNYNIDYQKRKNKVNKLLLKFIKEINN